jgi:hypothetical protein
LSTGVRKEEEERARREGKREEEGRKKERKGKEEEKRREKGAEVGGHTKVLRRPDVGDRGVV